MNQPVTNQAFDQADKLFRDALKPTNALALAEQSVAASKVFVTQGAAIAQDSAKVISEIADMAWSSTKILNEKIMQNLATNVETVFAAAFQIVTAKSLPEISKIQSDFAQKLAAHATEQSKEFVDLSARATQHMFEKVQTAAAKSFKPSI